MDVDDLTRKAKAGNCAAHSVLGYRYLYGSDGVALDYAEAFRLLSAAACHGASRAVANQAHMYAQGLGVQKDTAKAIQLYQQVGELEFFAAIALGRIYSKGADVLVSTKFARYWYAIVAGFEGRILECDELREAKTYIKSANPQTPLQ